LLFEMPPAFRPGRCFLSRPRAPCSPPRLFATSPRISLSMQPVHPSPSYLPIKLIWLPRGGRARCCLAVSIPCRRPPSALTPVGGSSGGRGGNRARRHEGILRAGATGVSRETTDLAGQGSRSKQRDRREALPDGADFMVAVRSNRDVFRFSWFFSDVQVEAGRIRFS
jgi:hypothetical protein